MAKETLSQNDTRAGRRSLDKPVLTINLSLFSLFSGTPIPDNWAAKMATSLNASLFIYLFPDVLWFSLRMISSSFFRSSSRIFSLGRLSSERPSVSSFSNLGTALAAGLESSPAGVKFFSKSFQYSQTRKATAQTMSGASTKKRILLTRLPFLLFLVAILEAIIRQFADTLQAAQKAQRRGRILVLVSVKT